MNVSINFEAIRARLAKTTGKEYWRSLEELAESEAFQESLRREFPNGAAEWVDSLDRRRCREMFELRFDVRRMASEYLAAYRRVGERRAAREVAA